MNDRERIARAMIPAVFVDNPTPYQRQWQRDAYGMADAVLATLDDRLLPELPEWVERIGLETSTDGWAARLLDRDHGRMTPKVTGPTIAAAIRDALRK